MPQSFKKLLKINIVTQFVAFFLFAITLNLLNLNILTLIFAALIVVLMWVKNHRFYRLTKRLKWFYVVMLVIFAFNTPGEHVNDWPISPTYEGLRDGLVQLLRINVMLAALSILLAINSRQQLISGFYLILSPLRCLGLDVERFAARLWLTLHYVEIQQQTPKSTYAFSHLGEKLASIFSDANHDDVAIVLEKPRFTWLDSSLIMLMLALLALILFKVGV